MEFDPGFRLNQRTYWVVIVLARFDDKTVDTADFDLMRSTITVIESSNRREVCAS